jgi:hypothetical protein
MAQAILKGESQEQINKVKNDYDVYLKKYGSEGTLDEVANRIKVAVTTIQEDIKKYPEQLDFQAAYRTHSEEYNDRYLIADSLASLDEEMGILIKNGKENLKEADLSIALLKIEIILIRIKILESEYMDNFDKIENQLLNEIHLKVGKINDIKGEQKH